MVKLRLRRLGKKKQPIYKVVAADSRAARTGKYLETVGTYDPLVHPLMFDVKENRLFYWLKNGAQPSDTVRSLLRRKGIWLKWTLVKKGADEATVAAELDKWQMLQTEKLKREEEKKARRKAARKLKAHRPADTAAVPKDEAPAKETKPVDQNPENIVLPDSENAQKQADEQKTE